MIFNINLREILEKKRIIVISCDIKNRIIFHIFLFLIKKSFSKLFI